MCSTRMLRSSSTAFHSIPAIRSNGSTSVLSTRKIRPIYSHPVGSSLFFFASDFAVPVLSSCWSETMNAIGQEICFLNYFSTHAGYGVRFRLRWFVFSSGTFFIL